MSRFLNNFYIYNTQKYYYSQGNAPPHKKPKTKRALYRYALKKLFEKLVYSHGQGYQTS